MGQIDLGRRPAVRVALLVILGILVASSLTLPLWISYIILLVLSILTFIGFLRSPNTVAVAVGFHVIVVLTGFHLAASQRHKLRTEILVPEGLEESISLTGFVESEPISKKSRSELLVRTSAVTRKDTTFSVERRVLVVVRKAAHTDHFERLAVGDNVEVHGNLEALPGPRNPGEFDYGRFLVLNGVQGIVVVHDTSGIKRISASDEFSLVSFISSAQKEIYRILDRFHSPEQAGFLKGIVFGYRADISLDIKQSFIDTGTIHILAVSGSNVLFVALIFHSLARLFRLSKRGATVVTILALLMYMVITGLSPSVIRATIMAAAILLGTLFERKTDIYNSLAAAALVMLLWDPMYIFDVGFQLSFAAVFSIVYFYPKLELLIHKIPERFEEIKAIDYVLKLFAVSLAAQIGTLPFTAYYFGRVSIVSILANLVVVPVSGINVLLGFATLAFSYVSTWIADCYAALNGALVSFLLGFVSAASKAPLAYAETSDLSGSIPVFYYLSIGAVFSLANGRRMVKFIIALLVALNVLVFADLLTDRQPALTFTAIDVGQGDALLLEFPNNKRVLIDGGPRSLAYDAGERVVAPFLKRKGIRRLDAIVVTHGHSDHIGGVQYLLDHFDVKQIVEPSVPATSTLYLEMLATAERRGVAIRRVSAGDTLRFDTTARVFILHPRAHVDSSRNLNNTSLVLKILYGKTSFLLPGDSETDAEGKVLQRYGALLRSNILKAGHHGSSTSSSVGFLDKVRPAIAVISVGRNNKFRHPSPEVIERFREMRIDVVRTDRDGAMILRSDGAELETMKWKD